jgi:hypothetical protein
MGLSLAGVDALLAAAWHQMCCQRKVAHLFEKGWKGIGAVSATFPSCVQTIWWMGHRLEAEGGGEEFAVEFKFRG